MYYFEYNWLFYIKIIPWYAFWNDILINSVKANINSFWIRNNWYWLEIFIYKQKNKINIEQYICSNSKEWIIYLINFYKKLYAHRVSFSVKINKNLILFNKFRKKYQIWQRNNWVLQIKKMWSLWDNNFWSSISINSWIVDDYSSLMNENEIIKVSFLFSKWSYSKIIKDYLYLKYSKWMSEEEKDSFFKSFSEWQNFFKFRYFFETNKNNNDSLLKVIEKNLMLYDSLYNNYFIQEKKNIFSILSEWKRIIQWEALLSQGLILPIVNNNTEIQSIPLITTNNKLRKSWFIVE